MAPGGGQKADIDLYDDNAYYPFTGSSFSWSLNVHSAVWYCYSDKRQRSVVSEEVHQVQEQKPHYQHEEDVDDNISLEHETLKLLHKQEKLLEKDR